MFAFDDLTGRHIGSRVGTPTVVADTSKWDGLSMRFDGAGDWLEFTGDLSDLSFAPGQDFCIEFAFRSTKPDVIALQSGNSSWSLSTSSGSLLFYSSSSSPGVDLNCGYVCDGNWHVCCVERSGDTLRGFVDGAVGASFGGSAARNHGIGAGPLSIGANAVPRVGTGNDFLGEMSHLRITRAARYSGAYAPAVPRFSAAGDPLWASVVLAVSMSVASPDQLVTIDSMEKDTDVPGDWLTEDGTAPRKVFGTISSLLLPNQVLRTSCDNGTTWQDSTPAALSWEITDNQFHTENWTILAKVVNTLTLLEGPLTARNVTYVPPKPVVLPQGSYTTLLDVIRRFVERTGLPKPAFSLGNTDAQILQILGLLEEACEELVMRNARGWQILNREAVFTTKAQEIQGSLSSLAPGFRTIINDTIFNRTTRLPLYGPLTPMERQATKALQTAGPFYRYWIANDQLHLYPTPPAGQTLAFEYTSTACWTDGQVSPRYSEYPESDTDICLFPKPIVIAQLRWRWKAEKGLEYAQDFAAAEMLLNSAIAADGTRRVVDLAGTELVARPGIMVPTGNWNIK